MNPKKNLTDSLSKLLSVISLMPSGRVEHVCRVLEALAENPDSVAIDHYKLGNIWPRYREYVKANSSGYILFLLHRNDRRHKQMIFSTLKASGIDFDDVRIQYYTSQIDACVEIVNSDPCRLVLYFRGLPDTLLDNLHGDTSQKIESFSSDDIRRGIVDIAKRLGYL